jgi:hypothetical protein
MTTIEALDDSDPWLFGSLSALKKEQATRFDRTADGRSN